MPFESELDVGSDSESTSSKSASPSSPHRTIVAGGKKMQLMHNLSMDELKDLIGHFPGLLAQNIAVFDPRSAEKMFKVVIGEGAFSRIRLAKYVDETGQVSYYAERKILSQKKLDERHVKKTKKSEVKQPLEEKPEEKSVKREDVVLATQRELNILGQIAEIKKDKDSVFFTEEKNRQGQTQIYQFIKIAAFKDLNGLSSLFDRAELGYYSGEKNAVLELIAHQMISEVTTLNALNIFHRDIKPANFLLTAEGKVTLSDYGSVAIRKADNTWEVGSSLSDAHYSVPAMLFDPGQSMEVRSAIADQWALGISILEIYGVDVTKDNFELYVYAHKKMKEALPGADPYNLIKNHYEKFVNHTKSHYNFTKMPVYLQQIVSNALNLDYDRNLDIKHGPRSLASNEIILQKVIRDATQANVRLNNEFISQYSSVLQASTGDDSSLNTDNSPTFGKQVDLGNGYFEFVVQESEDPDDSLEDDNSSETVSVGGGYFELAGKSDDTAKEEVISRENVSRAALKVGGGLFNKARVDKEDKPEVDAQKSSVPSKD